MDQMIEPILALEERLRSDRPAHQHRDWPAWSDRAPVCRHPHRTLDRRASQIDRHDCFVCRPCPHLRVYDIDHLSVSEFSVFGAFSVTTPIRYSVAWTTPTGPLRTQHRSTVFGDHRPPPDLFEPPPGRGTASADGASSAPSFCSRLRLRNHPAGQHAPRAAVEREMKTRVLRPAAPIWAQRGVRRQSWLRQRAASSDELQSSNRTARTAAAALTSAGSGVLPGLPLLERRWRLQPDHRVEDHEGFPLDRVGATDRTERASE